MLFIPIYINNNIDGRESTIIFRFFTNFNPVLRYSIIFNNIIYAEIFSELISKFRNIITMYSKSKSLYFRQSIKLTNQFSHTRTVFNINYWIH